MSKYANGCSVCNRRLAVAKIHVSFKTIIISFMLLKSLVGQLFLRAAEAVGFIN